MRKEKKGDLEISGDYRTPPPPHTVFSYYHTPYHIIPHHTTAYHINHIDLLLVSTSTTHFYTKHYHTIPHFIASNVSTMHSHAITHTHYHTTPN